jgi:cell division transport system permease protein
VRLRLLLSESFRSLSANLSTSIAATMTVLIGMFLFGLFIALGTWVVSYTDHLKRELVVHVYFCTPLTCSANRTDKQIEMVREKLAGMPEVKAVRIVPKEQALRELRKQHPEFFKQPLAANPLPDAVEVVPKRGEDVEKIATALGKPPGVQKVNYGKKTAHSILRAAKLIETFFLIAVLVLLAASTMLIANTIRLSIFSRRREIEVMKLVGATNWFVRGPFMLEGLICGLIGAVSAIVLLLLGKELVLSSILRHVTPPADVQALGFAFTALILMAVGLLLGAAGSGITLRRFLRV